MFSFILSLANSTHVCSSSWWGDWQQKNLKVFCWSRRNTQRNIQMEKSEQTQWCLIFFLHVNLCLWFGQRDDTICDLLISQQQQIKPWLKYLRCHQAWERSTSIHQPILFPVFCVEYPYLLYGLLWYNY